MCVQVVLPYRLQMEVDTHLQAYLSRKPKSRDKLLYSPMSERGIDGSIAVDDLYGEQEHITPNSVVVEKIQHRRSLQLRNKQQDWRVNLAMNFVGYFIDRRICVPSKLGLDNLQLFLITDKYY